MIVIINAFGVCGYGEFEFLAVLLKLCAIIIFMIVALALVCGGGPSDGKYNHYIGAHYWYNPGSFNNGFKGFCEVFVTAAFSYSGTEIVGLTAAESKDPVNTLPTAIKQV
ncbi:Amino-acid permease inda1, partial [Ascosphaera atra]